MLFNPLGDKEFSCRVGGNTARLISRPYATGAGDPVREPFEIIIEGDPLGPEHRFSIDVSLAALQGIFAVLFASRIAIPDIHTLGSVRDISSVSQAEGKLG